MSGQPCTPEEEGGWKMLYKISSMLAQTCYAITLPLTLLLNGQTLVSLVNQTGYM